VRLPAKKDFSSAVLKLFREMRKATSQKWKGSRRPTETGSDSDRHR